MPLYANMRLVQNAPLDSEMPKTGLRSAIKGKLLFKNIWKQYQCTQNQDMC